jgi:prepilin-type N-terminal cleavage/methylation domain-containing protein
MSRRRAFTLIELLMAVAIIVILAGMSLAILAMLRNKAKVAGTWDLMTHVTTAIDQYLQNYQRLGDPPPAVPLFKDDPWYFFYKQQHALKKPPLLEIPLTQLVQKVGAGVCARPEAPQTATHLVDKFGNNPANVLSIYTLNGNKNGTNAAFAFVQCIIVRSSAGTVGDVTDDLIFAWSSDKASWRKVRVDEIESFVTELDRGGTGGAGPALTSTEIDNLKKWTNPLE